MAGGGLGAFAEEFPGDGENTAAPTPGHPADVDGDGDFDVEDVLLWGQSYNADQ